MNSVFNIHRFWNTLKRDVALCWQYPVILFISTFITFFISYNLNKDVNEVSSFWIFLEAVCIFIFSSLIGNNLKTKKIAFDTLTLPASNLEKFISRLLMFFVFPISILVIVFFIIANNDYFIEFFEIFRDNMFWFSFILFIITIQTTIFIIGGIVFKRFSFCLTIIIECFVIYFIVKILDNCDFLFLDPLFSKVNHNDFTSAYLWEIAILFLFMIVNFTISYILFCRKQITINKLSITSK
ncbi:MAG: hypothetical protein MJ211_01465 [Bacteroidales bacterium]|nr:hypothetical protein [Bacteroidales bacterium]